MPLRFTGVGGPLNRRIRAFNALFTPPKTIDICVHHGGRIVTTNVLYDYWGGEEHMICNVKTSNFGIQKIIRLVKQHLSQYNDVCAYYFRVPTVAMGADWSLRKIEHEEVLISFLDVVQVGYALDIYLAHRSYPTLIDPNPIRWRERRWEKNGWISGHVERKRRRMHNKKHGFKKVDIE